MARPEKRWQLLLVADDGRIIPFKRIKGIAVTLVILLVILALVCAGLAWQLTAEKVRHRRTFGQLTDANRQVAHYKSEHELISAELVLAEARMDKAGLPVPRRKALGGQKAPVKTVDAQPLPEPKGDDGNQASQPIAAAKPPTVNRSSAPAAPPPASQTKAAVPEAAPPKAPTKPKPPAVAMDDLEIKHDPAKKILRARFRVKNTGPRSSPVAGRCVVVLKNEAKEPAAWLAMPSVTLVNGIPDGTRGQAFKISRYRDMEIKVMGQADPSAFKSATVYVFDSSGAKILEKAFSIDLPAPKPAPQPIAPPAVQPATVPVDQPAAAEESREAAKSPPPATTPESEAGTTPPLPAGATADDPSLTEGVEPVEKEDTRSRF